MASFPPINAYRKENELISNPFIILALKKGDYNMRFRKEKYVVIQEKKGYYYFRVKFQYGEGKTYSKTFNSLDYSSPLEAYNEACKHRDMKRAELHHGALTVNAKKTLHEIYELTLETLPIEESTKDKYRILYKRCIAPEFDSVNVQDITGYDITKNLNTFVHDMSQDSLGRLATVWKALMKIARLKRYISVNPFEEVIVPKSKKIVQKRPQNASSDEIENVIDLLMNHEKEDYKNYGRILRLMQRTGIRPAEAYSLFKEDINFDDHYIFISHTCNAQGDIKKAKTDLSVRKIPITPDIEQLLKEAMKKSNKERVFIREDGTPYCTDNTWLYLTYLKKLGYDFHPYLMRHKFSTDLITQDTDIRTVMELMGHNKMDMTLEYARSDDSLKEQAIYKLKKS